MAGCRKPDVVETTPLPQNAGYRSLRIEIGKSSAVEIGKSSAVDANDLDTLGRAIVDRIQETKRLRLAAKDAPADLTLKVSVVAFEESGVLGSDPMKLVLTVDFVDDRGQNVGRVEITTRGKDRERVTASGALPMEKERDLYPAIKDAARVIARYVEERAK